MLMRTCPDSTSSAALVRAFHHPRISATETCRGVADPRLFLLTRFLHANRSATSLENAFPIDAFSSREPVPTPLENATVYSLRLPASCSFSAASFAKGELGSAASAVTLPRSHLRSRSRVGPQRADRPGDRGPCRGHGHDCRGPCHDRGRGPRGARPGGCRISRACCRDRDPSCRSPCPRCDLDAVAAIAGVVPPDVLWRCCSETGAGAARLRQTSVRCGDRVTSAGAASAGAGAFSRGFLKSRFPRP